MIIPSFDPTESPISVQQIDGAGLLLGIEFPASYRDVMAQYNGSYGDAEFPIPGSAHGGTIGHWLSLRPWDSESVWSWLANWSEHELPPAIVPFGGVGDGNLVCFDYRTSRSPAVVMWYHELTGDSALHPVAPDFDTFASGLRASEP